MSRRSLTLSQLTSSVPDVITPATMIPPQVGPASASSISATAATADSPAMGNFVNSPGAVGATSTTTTSATSITTTPNDLSTIQVLSIFRGHLPLDCSVPADRPGRMVVMKVFAKKVQHSKSIRFVNMLFDGESVKLLETLSPGTSSLPDDQQQQQQQKEVLLEIKGTAIDVVRLSKRDPTFFYFTTRNASWTDDQAAEGQSSSPLLNYPMGGDCSSITGFDVFAFHATSPRSAERCYRLLHQFSEINAASEQLMVKFGATGSSGGKAPGSSGGFFHLAGSLLSSPSMMAVVTEAAINHANLNNNNPAIITNHNNNNITLPYLSHCDGKSSKSMSSSVKSILVGNGSGSGSGGEPREAHRVTFVSGLERKRGYEGSYYGQEEEEESSASASPPQSSMPASADLLLCDFSSAERQHSDTSMSDLFDDLAPTSSSGGQAPRAKVLAGVGEEVDLLGDLFKPTAPTLFPPVQQQQQPIAYLPPPPPPQQRPMQPSHLQQQQQPMFVPSNPFVAPSSTPVAPVYGSFAPLNPFTTGMPLQPQPVQMMMNSGASSGQYQSLCSGGLGTQPSRKSLNSTSSSAFSTDFNDFLQQTVKGHFKA